MNENVNARANVVEYNQKKRTTRTFIVSVCFLFIAIYFDLTIGAFDITYKDFLDYFVFHNDTKQTFIIHNVRMPRMIGGLLIGAALAVAGLFMQVMARNPLASPQIFGVNAGASFVVVFISIMMPTLSPFSILFAFLGAFVGGAIVYTLAGATKGMTPVKLALAGMTVHLFFASMTQGLVLFDEDATTNIYFWLVGSLHTLKWEAVMTVLPWLIGAGIVAVCVARQVMILDLGEEMSKALGQNTGRIRLLLGVLVIILAGASVSIAGPIGFVGLIVPHIVKFYVRHNYYVIVPLTMILGATLLLASDVLSRLIAFPFESPVGVVTAFVGALYFLMFTLRGGKKHA